MKLKLKAAKQAGWDNVELSTLELTLKGYVDTDFDTGLVEVSIGSGSGGYARFLGKEVLNRKQQEALQKELMSFLKKAADALDKDIEKFAKKHNLKIGK